MIQVYAQMPKFNQNCKNLFKLEKKKKIFNFNLIKGKKGVKFGVKPLREKSKERELLSTDDGSY